MDSILANIVLVVVVAAFILFAAGLDEFFHSSSPESKRKRIDKEMENLYAELESEETTIFERRRIIERIEDLREERSELWRMGG